MSWFGAARWRGRIPTLSHHARCLLLVVALLVAFVTPRAAHADDDDWHRFVEGVAALTFKLAWPTAGYESWEWGGVRAVGDDRYAVVFRLHGRSAFGGGPLWVDVVTVVAGTDLENLRIENVQFGENNAVLMPPGATVRSLGAALVELNAEYRRQHGIDGAASPPPEPSLAEAAPPPPPAAFEPAPARDAAATDAPVDAGQSEQRRMSWMFQLGLEYSNGGANILPANAPMPAAMDGVTGTVPNGLRFILGHVNVHKMMPLASWAYVSLGGDVGIGSGVGGRCTKPPVCVDKKCTCPGEFASWQGLTAEYGITGRLLLTTPVSPGVSTFSITLPTLRAEHLLTKFASHDANCASVLGSCSGFSINNFMLSATSELTWTEWSHGSVGGGCGVEVGVMALFGELADHNRTRYLFTFRGGPHLDWY